MFHKSVKIGKRREGILKVFTKTIDSLDKLEQETAVRISKQEERIAKEQKEKDALEHEKVVLGRTVTSMRKALGMDEDPAPLEPVTESKAEQLVEDAGLIEIKD